MNTGSISWRRRFSASLCITTIILTLSAGAIQASASDSVSSHVVVLRSGVLDPAQVAQEHALSYGIEIGFIYRHALSGYSAVMSDEVASLIATDLRVENVGGDAPVKLLAQTIPTGVDRIYDPATNNSSLSGLTINGSDDLRVDADIAIIDTGIDNTHPDLNAVGGTDCTRATTTGTCVDGFSGDTNSHGTHVAGIAAALDNGVEVAGVASGARLWSVDVLNSSGTSMSSLLAGIDWVTSKADVIETANISLACTYPCAEVNLAIKNSVAKGITYAVAAGNSGADASYSWPANSPDALTVSALADADGKSGGTGWQTRLGCYSGRTEVDDYLASYSNWGPVIDIASPGDCIYSTVPGGGYMNMSGTSMAAPHVAGAAALLASLAEFRGNPGLIRQTLLTKGNFDFKDNYWDTVKEPLLEVTSFRPVTVMVKPNAVPKASFTKSCSGATCAFTSTSSDPDGAVKQTSWSFGDGTSANGVSVAHTYGSTGKFVVTLAIVDDRGASATSSQTVTCQNQKGKFSCR